MAPVLGCKCNAAILSAVLDWSNFSRFILHSFGLVLVNTQSSIFVNLSVKVFVLQEFTCQEVTAPDKIPSLNHNSSI